MADYDPNQPPRNGPNAGQLHPDSQTVEPDRWASVPGQTPTPQVNLGKPANPDPAAMTRSWHDPMAHSGGAQHLGAPGVGPAWQAASPPTEPRQGAPFSAPGQSPYPPQQGQSPYPPQQGQSPYPPQQGQSPYPPQGYGPPPGGYPPHSGWYPPPPPPRKSARVWIIATVGVVSLAVVTGIISFNLLGDIDDDLTFGPNGLGNDPGQEVYVGSLNKGDCVDGIFVDELIDLVAVETCSSAHTSEVITRFEVADTSYPSDERYYELFEEKCLPLALELAADEIESRVVVAFTLDATREGWADGDRDSICFIEIVEGNSLSGSFLDGTATVEGTNTSEEEEPDDAPIET